ncbi:MAG: O-antigen ligase family protein [Verrucomicrobia bacterium]|nr:O-antigen ligase family protein [Verrucomicrobiota bacterium]
MELKYVIFFGTFFTLVPAIAIYLRHNNKYLGLSLAVLCILMPFLGGSMGIAFFGEPFYKGTSRGFEIALFDLVNLGILLTLVSKKHFTYFPPGSALYLMYYLLSAISLINADSLLISGYELLKMILMYLFFLVTYNHIIRFKNLKILLYSLAIVLILNFISMINQKYIQGYYQPSGLFPHRNSAAMFINLLAPIFLSYLLNCNLKRKEFVFFLGIFTVCAISVVFALSRGAIFFFPISCAIVTFLSLLHKITTRKLIVIMGFFVLAIMGTIKAAPMIIDRFENAPEASGNGRVELAKIALKMANDRFFGVGLNNWSIKASWPYSYTDYDIWPYFDRETYKLGLVETAYLLVAAECGWIGLLSFLLWLGYYYIQNISNFFHYRKTTGNYMTIGILAGLTAIYGQTTLEWVIKQGINFYELMLIFAIVAAMKHIYGDYRKSQKNGNSYETS